MAEDLPETETVDNRLKLANSAHRRWLLAATLAVVAAAAILSILSRTSLDASIQSLTAIAGGFVLTLALAPRRHMRELALDPAADIALLAERASRVAEGDRSVPLSELVIDRNDAVGLLSRTVQALAAETRSSRHHARLMSRRIGHHVQRETLRATTALRQQAMSDPLTGLGNRRGLHWHVDRLINTHGEAAPATALLFDGDRFKQINDVLGHAEGDRCLKHLAQVLRACLRGADVIVRIGGDEFLVLMPNAATEHAIAAAQRVQSMFAQMSWSSHLERPSLSVGIAHGRLAEARDGGAMLSRADEALYSAKRQGRACIIVYGHAAVAA